MNTVLRTAAVGALAFVLAGCVHMSRSEAVAPMAEADAKGSRVTEITLARSAEVKVTPEFEEIFKKHVQAKLDSCATGSRPLRLEASVDRLDKANPALTTLVAGANVLRGTAQLVDPATGRVVGSYKIGQTVVGGRFAIIKMGEAEEQMSDAFGDELCEKAFGAKSATPAQQ